METVPHSGCVYASTWRPWKRRIWAMEAWPSEKWALAACRQISFVLLPRSLDLSTLFIYSRLLFYLRILTMGEGARSVSLPGANGFLGSSTPTSCLGLPIEEHIVRVPSSMYCHLLSAWKEDSSFLITPLHTDALW